MRKLMAALAGSLALTTVIGLTDSANAQVLEAVRSRGAIRCGANNQLPGFGNIDADGNFVGFDIDFCRAVSAAVFGDPDQVEYVYLTAANRQSAVQAGEIDMMSRNTTWTLTRVASGGVTYGPTTFYDGQGFIVRADLGVTSLEDLDGATICVIAGTTTELNLADTFRARGIEFTPVVFDGDDATFTAYEEGRCDANTTDRSALFTRRTTLADPSAHVILEEIISKEPLGPLVAQGDDQWADIMNWSIYAMFYAEEKGITSANVDEFLTSEDPDIRRFLGVEGNMGELLGLEANFAYNIIKTVGNYAEIYETHLAPLGISRGLNASYIDGGLIYAPPFR